MNPTRQARRLPILIVALVIIALVAGSWYYYFGRNKLVSMSSHILDTALAGDSDGLYAAMHPDERKALGLSREEWGDVFHGYIWPELKKWDALGGREVGTDERGAEFGSASQTLVSKDGRRFGLAFSTFATEKGPMPVVSLALIGFAMRAPIQHEVTGLPPEMQLQFLQGRRRTEYGKLSALGLRGVFKGDKRRLATWDEIIAEEEATIIRIQERNIVKSPSQGKPNPVGKN